jgi:hypothetical protein
MVIPELFFVFLIFFALLGGVPSGEMVLKRTRGISAAAVDVA